MAGCIFKLKREKRMEVNRKADCYDFWSLALMNLLVRIFDREICDFLHNHHRFSRQYIEKHHVR